MKTQCAQSPALFALHLDLGDRPLLDTSVREAHGLQAMGLAAERFQDRARHYRVAGARVHQRFEPARLALRTRMQRDDHPELAHRTPVEQTSRAAVNVPLVIQLRPCENSNRRERIETRSPLALAPPPSFPASTIEADRLKTFLDQGVKLVLVDVRSPAEYQKGHIPGARSLSLHEPAERSDALIVLYCDCPLAEINPAYQFLRFHGYRQVLVLDGGSAAWAARGYPLKR